MAKYLLEGARTERMHFRRFTPQDFDLWLPFFLDPSSTRYWEGIPTDPQTACREQFQRIFERYAKDLGGMNALTHSASGELLGMCGLLVQQVDGKEELEIGYSLLPEARGLGYATEAGLLCRDRAFERGWAESLISIIHTSNKPSMQVATRLGMKRRNQTRFRDNPVWIYEVSAKK